MSMLTPVGTGGRLQGRRSRRRRWPVVVLVLAVLAGAAATWWLLLRDTGPGKATARATATCPPLRPHPAALVAPQRVSVNVYNATSRPGLAAATSERLGARGYAVGKIANDPLHRTVSGSAEIRYGEAGLAEARTVLAVAPGAEMVQDARQDAKVDLVLGKKWTGLAVKPVPPLVTPEPRPGCAPDGGRAEPARTAANASS